MNDVLNTVPREDGSTFLLLTARLKCRALYGKEGSGGRFNLVLLAPVAARLHELQA